MESVSIRSRSTVWFVAGALVATAVTLMFVNAWRVDAAPGDDDATFVPITVCRLADTRPAPNRVGTAAALGPEGVQTFSAHGSNGNCTLPTDAVALSLNVTAVGATAPTFLTFWPSGPRPTASSLNPVPNQPPTPNAVTVDLSDTGGFNVFNLAGTVNVVVDVNGYYVQSSLTELANRVAALEASVAGVESTASGNTAGIAALDAAQPFAVTDRISSLNVGTTDEVVVTVSVTAPVTGQVTVNSTTGMGENTAGHDVYCSITDGSTVDQAYRQQWQSGGVGSGGSAQLAGTRTFDITAGATVAYNLVCEQEGGGTSSLFDVVLTAIFTPAP